MTSIERTKGRRNSRTGNIEADRIITAELKTNSVPGHREFVRSRNERVSTPVIGSSLPESVRTAVSRIGTLLRFS